MCDKKGQACHKYPTQKFIDEFDTKSVKSPNNSGPHSKPKKDASNERREALKEEVKKSKKEWREKKKKQKQKNEKRMEEL